MASSTVSEIQTLVRPFMEICVLRRGPQDLPVSVLLMVITLVAHTISSTLLSAVTLDVWKALIAGIIDTLLVATLTGSVLYLHRLKARVVQTITAMSGAGAIISLAAIPLFTWLHGAQQSGAGSPFAALLVLGLIAWSLGVSGHILRHALSVPYILGILIAFAFFWISHTVFSSLFPVGG